VSRFQQAVCTATISVTLLLGPQLIDTFFVIAMLLPVLAWIGADRLHREREPTFRYRGQGRC